MVHAQCLRGSLHGNLLPGGGSGVDFGQGHGAGSQGLFTRRPYQYGGNRPRLCPVCKRVIPMVQPTEIGGVLVGKQHHMVCQFGAGKNKFVTGGKRQVNDDGGPPVLDSGQYRL